MNILIFGATGMVGLGVLRECLEASDVTSVTSVGRSKVAVDNSKLHQVTVPDLFEVDSYADALKDADACFYCLGLSVAGQSEETYTRLTHDLTLAIAQRLALLNPQMTFIYVTGMGTDSTEQGRTMWARVKGRTENDLKALPFRAVHLFRPAAILPANGEQSKTASYRMIYSALGWLLRPFRHLSRGYILTTEDIGQAMLRVARAGWNTAVLEPSDIRNAAADSRR